MTNYYTLLESLVENKEARIAVIGLGYVGLPLAKAIAESGFKNIIGLDIDSKKVELINSGRAVIDTFTKNDVDELLSSGFDATTDYSSLSEADVLIICVPTPLNQYKEPDISFITSTLKEAVNHLKKGSFLSLESTTWPGTTEEVIGSMLTEHGFSIGEDIFLGYSPEREDPGNEEYTTHTIPKVVSGQTLNCLNIAKILYSSFIKQIVPVSDTKTAELVKLLENIQRSVNIGLMNEMKFISDRMGINIFEVINAAATKPFGFMEYYPGPGVGGHCIPVDPYYLTWKAKEFNFHTKFIELAGEINDSVPDYIINKSISVLNRYKKSIAESKILVLGLSYKKNVGDLRESPNLRVLQGLIDNGANAHFSDPFFKKIPQLRKYSLDMTCADINKNEIESYDLILLLTDHDDFDYELIEKYSKHIIDARGRFKPGKKVTYA